MVYPHLLSPAHILGQLKRYESVYVCPELSMKDSKEKDSWLMTAELFALVLPALH